MSWRIGQKFRVGEHRVPGVSRKEPRGLDLAYFRDLRSLPGSWGQVEGGGAWGNAIRRKAEVPARRSSEAKRRNAGSYPRRVAWGNL